MLLRNLDNEIRKFRNKGFKIIKEKIEKSAEKFYKVHETMCLFIIN